MANAEFDVNSLTKTCNEFAVDLYANLCSDEGNLFFSPYSIRTALTMAYAGARARTAQQMEEVLHLPASGEALHRVTGTLDRVLSFYNKEKEIEINIANALWAQEGFGILEGFLQILSKHYGSRPRTVDFAHAPQKACDEINRWANDKTRGKISGLITPENLSDMTGLMLANAIYFKGMWKLPFRKHTTQPEEFKLTPGESTGANVKVPTMHQTDRFGYVEHPGFKVLEMPYAGEDLSMVILLPDRIDGLKGLEKSLSELAMWMQLLREQKVEVYVPKFKLSSHFDLAGMLGRMGMEDAVDLNKADFKGITTEDKFAISAVRHKAEVDVGEEGTEAAAVSLIEMAPIAGPPSEPPPIPVFRADHPFLFLIRATRLNCILFMGRVANPLAQQEE